MHTRPLQLILAILALGPGWQGARATPLVLPEAIRLVTTPGLALSAGQAAAAEAAITSAEAEHGSEASWRCARAVLLRRAGDRTKARDLLKQVVQADPGVADYQFWYGSLCFETINDAGLFEKMGLADKGKAALSEALRLNPSHIPARVGLFQYYANAPGIAGGSTAKARALCDELVALPEGKGEFTGTLLLAQLAGKAEDWAEMSRLYAAAETARGDGSGLLAALRAHARALLNTKKDAAGALAVVDRGVPLADSTEAQLWFIKGQAHQQLKQWAPAIEALTRAVEVNPTNAPGSLFGLAECHEAAGEYAAAAARYRQFGDLFPKDSRAEKAADGAQRCARKARP